MTAAQQEQARRALAFLVGTLRPDWDQAGITATIDQLHRDRENLGDISRAAVGAALTSSTRTPGGIATRIKDGWNEGAETEKRPTPGPSKLHRCQTCGRLIVPGLEHTETDCQPHGDDFYRDGAAAARARIAAYQPPAHLQPTGSQEVTPDEVAQPEPESEPDDEGVPF